MVSSEQKRRFPPPWKLVRESHDTFSVTDANGVPLVWIYCRDDFQHVPFAHNALTSEEARRIGKAVVRLPELLMQRHGFDKREGGPRYKPGRPYHVAIEDSYLRSRYDVINAICKLNRIPLHVTGERIQESGCWCVYEFAWQMDAILFWANFEGRWLRGNEFSYPQRPKVLPELKRPLGVKAFDPNDTRR